MSMSSLIYHRISSLKLEHKFISGSSSLSWYNPPMTKSIQDLTRDIVAFRDARDWKQFHSPKNLSMSLVLEATEVMEHFQWKSEEEIQDYVATHREDIGEELADTLYYVLLISQDLGVDIVDMAQKKLMKNEAKYPISKAKGKHTKYNKL